MQATPPVCLFARHLRLPTSTFAQKLKLMVTVMYPATPPVADITRPKLRHIAYWIRDELDPIIAREGPEQLRANDVLVLHDMFQVLRTSTTITALDLRATGIHKAVIDVSGIATRWPGRLCDDCDKIINIWTAKFGRLEDLRPFLYGRGGRLEGIRSLNNSTTLNRCLIGSHQSLANKLS
jgi:hypothetical protein